ncbi:hypothetical protein BC332_01626 [Capsicum chinense]|nr:hypothetical protein BC332_01626 [Capsicum chinense]
MAPIIQRIGFLGQSGTSLSWASRRNTSYLFLPTIWMTYVDAQITSVLTLLQKIEEKYSCLSHQIIVAYAQISATTVCSGEIVSPLAEANSSPVDNVEGHWGILDTFIDEHSGHVDNMFDEMSTGVFTEEVGENSPASIFLGDLDDIHSTRVLDEFVHSCCHKVVAEVQLDSAIKMLDEETLCLECSKIQLFNDCSLRSMSKRYVSTTSMDHSSSKQKIEFETLDDIIPPSNMPLDEMMFDGKFTEEYNAHNILCHFTFTPGANSFGFDVHGDAMNLSVWDPAKFVTQVWDPRKQRYELVVRKSKVDDTYSDVNRVFDESFQGAASRELQPIAPLHIIRLPKLFQFLQQIFAQLIFVLQAPKIKVWYAAIRDDFSFRQKITEQTSAFKMEVQGKKVAKTICIALLRGCINFMADLIERELRNFSTLVVLFAYIGTKTNIAYFIRHHDTILATRGADFVGTQTTVQLLPKNVPKSIQIVAEAYDYKIIESVLRYLLK